MEFKPASETPIDGVRGGARLSAMQVKRCFRNGERSLLAVVTLVSRELNSMDIAMEGATLNVRPLLQEFQDVFPEKLRTGLPPQRSVLHRIELTPSAQPPRNTT